MNRGISTSTLEKVEASGLRHDKTLKLVTSAIKDQTTDHPGCNDPCTPAIVAIIVEKSIGSHILTLRGGGAETNDDELKSFIAILKNLVR